MSGLCRRCHYPAATRSAMPTGPVRVGFVRETRLGSWLICLPCIVNCLPANVTA